MSKKSRKGGGAARTSPWRKAAIIAASVGTMISLPTLALESAASANTQGSANSYINTPTCLDLVPGDCTGFVLGRGAGVLMNCWEGGPQSYGQGKWFYITVRQSRGYGMTGWVPAPTVSNQWTSSPWCPNIGVTD
jgi:hypothetical protein